MNFVDSIKSYWLNYANFHGRTSKKTFLPSLALGVRRLQDMGKPGTYMWFILIPLAGAIMLLIWFLQPGQPHANKDGEPVL